MKRFSLPLYACLLTVLSILLVSCVPQAPGTVESDGAVELELNDCAGRCFWRYHG